ncbi:hypothetical protein ACGFIU_18780 [Rhodococcus oryzae]|uniref:hypothetical protein n=1 Tax=Rhodococcus oryzae TaxID=2571143 RepID=UPI00371637DF
MSGRTEVVLDPILWGDKVVDNGYWTAFKWLMKSAITIWMVNVVAALFAFVRGQEDDGRIDKWVLSRLYLAIGLVVRAVILLPGVVLCAVLLIGRGFRTKIVHAIAWTEESAQGRAIIASNVEQAILSVEARSRVLVGHSQGGSILAELAESGKFGPSTPLVTLGSGHGLLATQSVLSSRRWRLPAAIVLAGLFMVAMAAIAVQLAVLLVEFVRGVGTFLSAALWSASGTWVSGIDPVAAGTRSADGAAASFGYAMTELTEPSSSTPIMSAVVFMAISIMVVAGRSMTASLHGEIVAANRCSQPGIDIVALHDPVASALGLLGNRRRVVRVSQSDSMVFDHVAYFDNGLVLSEICRRIEDVVNARQSPPSNVIEKKIRHRGYELRAGLISRRLASFVMTAAMGAFIFHVIDIHGRGWAVGAGLVGMGVTAGVNIVARRRFLDRMTAMGGFDDYERASSIGELRMGRKSWIWAVVEGALALPLVASLVAAPPRVIATSEDWRQLVELQPFAQLAGVLLIIGAALTALGSHRCDLVAALGFSAASLVWLSLPQPVSFTPVLFGIANGAMAFAVWRRHRKWKIPGPLVASQPSGRGSLSAGQSTRL